jgi:hypothetical protein|nr:MAG TPA: hypothetical protein [Bacteriophage sp.]
MAYGCKVGDKILQFNKIKTSKYGISNNINEINLEELYKFKGEYKGGENFNITKSELYINLDGNNNYVVSLDNKNTFSATTDIRIREYSHLDMNKGYGISINKYNILHSDILRPSIKNTNLKLAFTSFHNTRDYGELEIFTTDLENLNFINISKVLKDVNNILQSRVGAFEIVKDGSLILNARLFEFYNYSGTWVKFRYKCNGSAIIRNETTSISIEYF